MPDGAAVTRHTLRQQIADALSDEILAGRLLPGHEFTVRTIAEQYGVSATPVREALVDLAAQGLLDSDQHRGFRVHAFSLADFRGMVEARSLLEEGVFRKLEQSLPGNGASGASGANGEQAEHGEAAEDGEYGERGAQAARAGSGRRCAGADGTGPLPGRPAATSRALASVRRRAQEAARAARAGHVAILIGYDLRFWRELNALGENRYVSEFLDRMRVKAWVFAVPFLREDPDARRWLWSGYEELVDAVIAGDPAGLWAALGSYNTHLLAWADALARRAADRAGRPGVPGGPVAGGAAHPADPEGAGGSSPGGPQG